MSSNWERNFILIHDYINVHKNIANQYCRISDCLSVILQKSKTVGKEFFCLIISSSLQIARDSSVKYAVSILQLELIFLCSYEWFSWVLSVGYCMVSITCFSTMNAVCCTSSERWYNLHLLWEKCVNMRSCTKLLKHY